MRLGALALLGAMCLAIGPGLAIGVDAPLADPALEARARAIHKTLRCLVCQNQSIEDSNADLARDLREIVRERIVAGDSDAEATQYVVDRYGDWVLLQPPFKAATYALWIGPFAVLVVAAGGAGAFILRRRAAAQLQPLSAGETERLRQLLEDGEGT